MLKECLRFFLYYSSDESHASKPDDDMLLPNIESIVAFEWLSLEAEKKRNLMHTLDVKLFAERERENDGTTNIQIQSEKKLNIFGMKNATAS